MRNQKLLGSKNSFCINCHGINKGDIQPKHWQIEITSVNSDMGIFEGTNTIARMTNSPLKVARETMENLPQVLPVNVYGHQGVRLIKMLQKKSSF